MDGHLGDIGAFHRRQTSLGLARRARGDEASPSIGEHREKDFYWIERDKGLVTYQPGAQTSTAFSQLQPAHQTVYRNLLWFAQDDATAEGALQNLLLKGKLTPALMNALGTLVTGAMAQGIERGQIVRETLKQLNDPMLVDQGTRSTCTTAVVQYLAIKKEPDRYVSMIAGLVSPSGRAQLPDGEFISRVGSLNSDGSSRTMVDQIVQNSLMQYASGSYDPKTDRNADSSTGLTAQRFDYLVEGVMNAAYSTREIDESYPAQQAIAEMKQATNKGDMVPVGLQWKSGGHKILVQGFDQGLVFYYNPWGSLESMKESELEGRIHNVSFR